MYLLTFAAVPLSATSQSGIDPEKAIVNGRAVSVILCLGVGEAVAAIFERI